MDLDTLIHSVILIAEGARTPEQKQQAIDWLVSQIKDDKDDQD